MSIQEYQDLAHSRKYRTPEHVDDDDLEKKYWKHIRYPCWIFNRTMTSLASVSRNRYNPPLYGADVTQSITDPGSKGFNAGQLDSILRHIKEDTDQTYSVSVC